MPIRSMGLVVTLGLLLAGCAGRPVPAPQPSSQDLLAAVAHGERTLLSLADRASGIALVRRSDDASGEDPRRDENGTIAVTRRICDAHDPELGYLTNDLAMHFQDEFDYAAFRCDELVCAAGGLMEYSSSLRLEFSRDGDRLVLARIYAVEDVALDSSFAAARWADAEHAMATIRGECPR